MRAGMRVCFTLLNTIGVSQRVGVELLHTPMQLAGSLACELCSFEYVPK